MLHLMAFEVLNLSLVPFRSLPSSKCPEILALVCLGIYFMGVESIFTGSQFSNHIDFPGGLTPEAAAD